MNKKILVSFTILLTIVMLTIPAVSAYSFRRSCCAQYFNVYLAGWELVPAWTKTCPSDAELTMDDGVYTDPDLKYVFTKSDFTFGVGLCVVTIGEEVFSSVDNEVHWGGTIWSVIFNPTDGENDYARYVIKWRIDFNPATTGIDGSIIIYTLGYNSKTDTPTSDGLFPTLVDYGKGYGTGDLEGVRTYDKGTLIFDFTQPIPVWVDHTGKIWGFP